MRLTQNFIALVFLFCTVSGSLGRDINDFSQLGAKESGLPNNHGDTLAGGDTASAMSSEEGGGPAERRARGASYNHEFVLWPNAIVPYTIVKNHSASYYDTLITAMKTIEQYTCVRFVPRTSERDYMEIKVEDYNGCTPFIGFSGGRNQLYIEPPFYFLTIGRVLHIFLHALGLIDEHNRHDRDEYITVHTENIMDGRLWLYEKIDRDYSPQGHTLYDYDSVMHFTEFQYSKNGSRTIVPKISNITMNLRHGLSRNDVIKINYMYGCNETAIDIARASALAAIRRETTSFGSDHEILKSLHSSGVLPNHGES